jgi:hypothetical protein
LKIKMIRSGKASPTGWLNYSHAEFGPWSVLSGITLEGVHVDIPSGLGSPASDVDSKGAGVVASKRLGPGPCSPLMTVPEELILSRQRVQELAAGDARLLDIFKACGDFVIVRKTRRIYTI